MPVNMDPSKKHRKRQAPPQTSPTEKPSRQSHEFGEETAVDREKDMADAEWKNLWDATEVIDMDKI